MFGRQIRMPDLILIPVATTGSSKYTKFAKAVAQVARNKVDRGD